MQRKVNTRFLVVLTAVVGSAILLFFLASQYLFKGTAQKHVTMAELYAREGRLAEAANEYRSAIGEDPRNAEVYVKLGDTMRQLTKTDPFVIDKDKFYWNLALEVDPSYLPAMQRLLDAYLEDSQFWAAAQTFARVRDICTRILAVDPTDARAKVSLHVSWLQSWLAGVETSQQQVDESVRELQTAQEKDPTNIDVPFYVARVRVGKATSFKRDSRDAEAAASVADSEKVMETCVANNVENARAWLRRGQVLLEIAMYYAKDPAKKKSYHDKAYDAIVKATELVKGDDPAFMEVKIAAAALAQQDQRNADAEKIYRELLSQHPDERTVRLALAQLLSADPAKRPEAISLLEESVSDDSGLVGPRVRMRSELQMRSIQVLAGLRIDTLAGAKTDEEKQDLKTRIEEHLKDIYNRQGESPQYLKLKGRYYQAQNQFVDAIQTYNRAAAMLAQSRSPQDDDMMFQLARVYVAAQQTGEARSILEGLALRYEAFVPARILLARLLIGEGSLDKARPHLDFLEKTAPNDPQVIALLLAASTASSGSGARTQELLQRLPEGSHDEKLAKARAAYESKSQAEATRLASELLKLKPGDEDAAVLLVQSLLRQGKGDEARRQLDTSIAAIPDGRNLKLLKAQLEGSEQVTEVLEGSVDEIKDEFARELAKARLAEAVGKRQEALGHLQKAEQLKPDAPEVWDMLFQYYARSKEWDKLQPYMDKLVTANQDRANGMLYRFRLQMARGEVSDAVETGRQLTVKLPEFAQSWLALGQALQAAGKYGEAKEAFLHVLEKQATNIEAYRGVIESCYAMRRFDDAGRHIAEGRKRMPSNPVLRQFEIDYELNYGSPEKVVGVLETQVSQQGEKLQAWMLLGRAYERILQRKLAKGDPEARKSAEKLRDFYSRAFEKWTDNADIAAKLADVMVLLSERDNAEKVLQRYVEKTGARVEATLLLSDFYVRTGQPSHAAMTLQSAITRFPDRIDLWQRLAGVQAATGDVAGAVKTLDSAPDINQVIMQKLEILLQAGKLADAKKVIEQAEKAGADRSNLLNAQAFIALQENDVKAAKEFAEKSLSLKPNNPVALQQRAMCRLRDARPDTDGAIVDLKLAMQQLPQNVELRLTAADAYLSRQDRDSAIHELEAALAFAPRSKAVWMRLLELYMASAPPKLDEARVMFDQVRAAGGEDVDLVVRSARLSAARKDAKTAISEMQRAVQLSEGNEAVVREYLAVLVELGQFDQVLLESEQLLVQAPKAWWIRYMRAIAMVRQGHKEDAIAEWEKAIATVDAEKDERASLLIMQGMAKELGVSQVLPRVLEKAKSEPRWVVFAAQLYQTAGDWHNALAMVEQVTGSLSSLPEEDQLRALSVSGGVYLALKPPMVEKAVAAYEQLLRKRPDDYATLNNLACVYIDNVSPPQPQKALEFSVRAYDSMRKNGVSDPFVLDTHGWVMTQAGHIQEGIVLLQEVNQKRPFIESRYHLGEAYVKGNYAEAAVRQLTEANVMIAAEEKNGLTLDAELKARVQQALAKASALVKEQGLGTGQP